MMLTIDGREVEATEGTSVLDAALAAGIYVPHICSHPDLEAIGGCGLCMVDVEGEEQPVPGQLFYRGFDVEDLVRGCERENRFGFEEIVYLLLLGELPNKGELAAFSESKMG